MPVEPQVTVTGADETAAAFGALSQAVANDVEAAARVAALGVEGASANAPVRTGELASSYAVEDRFVINPTPYAAFVEFGTSNMAAQYPIQLSLDALTDQAAQIYGDWVKDKASEIGFDATSG